MSARDIKTLAQPLFDWSDGQRAASLKATYDEIVGKLDDSIRWYQTKRSGKRKLAWCFRVGAIALGALAAAMPAVSEIAARNGPGVDWWLRPGTATIIGIAVGALIMMDKLIGASTAWVRYTLAETALKELRDELALAFTLEAGAWAGERDPCVEQTIRGLTLLQTFLTRVNQVVRDETNQWKAEFQSALAQTEEFARVQAKKVDEAVLTVKLSNPDRLAGGWTLSINDGAEVEVPGDSKSLRLAPGVITARIKATVKSGKDDQAVAAFATEVGDVLGAGAVKVVSVALPPKAVR